MDDNSSNEKVVSSSSPGNLENQNIDDQNVMKFVSFPFYPVVLLFSDPFRSVLSLLSNLLRFFGRRSF